MKDATELAIEVSATGFKFDGSRRRHLHGVGWVEQGTAELQPIYE